MISNTKQTEFILCPLKITQRSNIHSAFLIIDSEFNTNLYNSQFTIK